MEFIGEYHSKELSKLDNILELYSKIDQNKNDLLIDDLERITFDLRRNTFKVDNMTYKDANSKKMKIIEWYDILKNLNFNCHLENYDVSPDYEYIECYDQGMEEDHDEKMINWKVCIDLYLYQKNNDRAFDISIKTHGIHTFDKDSENKENDKCKIEFTIGYYIFDNVLNCKGYNINVQKDTVKCVQRLIKNIEKESDNDEDFPNYFIQYGKITQLGEKILNVLVSKFFEIIKYNSNKFK